MNISKNRWIYSLTILLICFGLAFLFAPCWVVLMTWNLPPTDGAYGSSPFGHPLVFPVMSMAATIAAFAVFPFTLIAFLNRKLLSAVCILAVIVLLEIIFVTPVDSRLSFLGSFVAYGMGLLVVWKFLPESGLHSRVSLNPSLCTAWPTSLILLVARFFRAATVMERVIARPACSHARL